MKRESIIYILGVKQNEPMPAVRASFNLEGSAGSAGLALSDPRAAKPTIWAKQTYLFF